MTDYSKVLSDRAQSLKPSAIRRFFDLMENMDGAISLGIGEPDFVTPWHIRDAGIYSLTKGFTKYSPNAGMSALRSEISAYLERRFNLSYDPKKQMIVTVGGSEGIDLAVRALVNFGDEVIVPVPSFVCYGAIVTMAGGVPVYIETKEENEFKLTPEELREAITEKTKAVILPFPNNPTGGVMEKQDLEAIAEILRKTDIMVITDEIYAELSYGIKHTSMANIDGMYDRTIYINGFSKSHAMTGWRLGYACGPQEIIAQMMKIHQYAIMCAPTTSQYAAIEAMREGDKDVENMRSEYDKRRRYMLSRVRKMGLTCFEPRGAFYMFPCIKSTGMTSEEFCEKLLLQEKVAAIPGGAFGSGGEGFVRMCYACSMDDIVEAMNRIERFLNTL